MRHLISISALALAPLAANAGDACCPDGGKFDAPAGHTHAHAEAGHTHHADANPRVTLKANQIANLAIKTEKIAPAKIARTAFALGDIEVDPRGESSAASRIAGRVVELKVALGDTVKKGDMLLVVESRQPGGDPAKIAVTALADGTVTEVLTRLGDPVSPDAQLLKLADYTRLIAEARIPQRYASDLTPGMTLARMTPEGSETREVTLDSFTPKADPVAGTLTARFSIDNTDGSLTPGRRVEFQVILSQKEFPVTVPRDAVQGEKGDLFVFVEETPGVYEKHPVRLGEGDERTVAITGPEAGERVVTHGAYSLCYADASNVSLQEAMEAAHGHKHGPNGEEPGEEGHAEGDHKHADGDAHDHEGHTHAAEGGKDHDHAAEKTDAHEGHVHDADGKEVAVMKGAENTAASAAKTPAKTSALQEAMDAAHGHKHGPGGEEPEGHDDAKKSGRTGLVKFLTGDSGWVFFATLAAGEAALLALAVTALRRKNKGTDSDA